MKTHLTAVFGLSLALTGCVSAQTFPEIDLGQGFEPSVATNRRDDGGRRLAVAWLKTGGSIVRKWSATQGASFFPEQVVASPNCIDPTVTANLTTGDTYYSYMAPAGLPGRELPFFRSPNDGPQADQLIADVPRISQQTPILDRPWLIATATRVFVNYFVGAKHNASKGVVPGENVATTWASQDIARPVETGVSGVALMGPAALARGSGQNDNQTLFLMTLHIPSSGTSHPSMGYRVWRSPDAGSSWTLSSFPHSLAGIWSAIIRPCVRESTLFTPARSTRFRWA